MYQQAKARHPSFIQSGLQSVWEASQKDYNKISPVDLSIDDSKVVQLAPLVWTGYRQSPSSLTVKNCGFTVRVDACFERQADVPRLSQGPLRAEYAFTQIHFHWNSGHAIKGVRYPLEMHVVHMKKDCANFREAVESKDGIVVVVYLFALREERNHQMDQLTAILQFIRKSGARARLHPTALSELVPPFTRDYFLYWGTVRGAPKGRFRIMWMVTRNVLPVSAQQLCEFTQLYDKEGNLVLNNSNEPVPLGERTLFLVSPSEETQETVYGIVGTTLTHRENSDQTKSAIEIRDAEYKSLANLEDEGKENCRVCSIGPKRHQNVTRVNVAYPYRVYEGDTSVEESCVDLSNNSTTDEDPGVTVKTETKTGAGGRRVTNVTNVNVTTCRRRCKAQRPEEVYSVVSARGSELHLRRKTHGGMAATFRQQDPSVEQACVLLTATRSNSAPSLAWQGQSATRERADSHAWHGLSATQEYTDLTPGLAPGKMSSEMAVHERTSQEDEKPLRSHVPQGYYPVGRSQEIDPPSTSQPPRGYYPEERSQEIQRPSTPQQPRGNYQEYDEYEDEYEENLRSSKKTRRVTVVDNYRDNVYRAEDKDFRGRDDDNCDRDDDEDPSDQPAVRIKSGKSLMSMPINNPHLDKNEERGQMEYNEEHKCEIYDKKLSKYFLVQKIQEKNPFYKVIRELPKEEIKSSQLTSDDVPYETGNYKIDKNISKIHAENPAVPKNPIVSNYSAYEEETYYDEVENHKTTRNRNRIMSNIRSTKIADLKKEEEINTTDCNDEPKLKDSKSPETKAATECDPPSKSKPDTKVETECDPPYKLSVTVRTTVSDHRKPGKKPHGVAKEYYVTKISPKDQPIFVTPKSSNIDVQKCHGKSDPDQYYYAQPIEEKEKKEPNKPNGSYDYVANEEIMSEYKEDKTEKSQKRYRELHFKTASGKDNKVAEYEQPPLQTMNTNSNVKETPQDTSVFHIKQHEIKDETGDSYNGSSNKHISRQCNSSDITKNSKRSNLIEHVNVYHGKNPPDEDIRMVNKTITGTLGKSDSTDVLINGRRVEVVSPNKTDVSNEIKYRLVTSKHPEPQYFVKEPQTKYGPITLVHQYQSLDQQVQGQSKVRQTVECLDQDTPNTSSEVGNRQGITKSVRSGRNMITERYDHSSHELVSSSRKTKQVYGHMVQGESVDPIYHHQTNPIKNDDQTTSNIKNIKDQLIGKSIADVKSIIPYDHKNNTVDDELLTSRTLNKKSNVNMPTENNMTKDDEIMTHKNKDPRNKGISNFEYEETSSLNQKFESAKVKRKFVQVSEPLASISNRREGGTDGTVSTNQNKLPDSSQPKSLAYSNDRKPKVSFQNDPNVYRGIEFEETTEEDSIYTSRKMQGKRIISQRKGNSPLKGQQNLNPQLEAPTYHNSNEIKIQIPEPHYITRVPKQPVVEFEAYPVDPHEPFKIISGNQEISTSMKTHKTFMMFKKINGKAVLNQPSVIEPMQIKPNRNEPYGRGQFVVEQIRSDTCSQDEIPLNRSRTVVISPVNQEFKEESYDRNMTQDKPSKSVVKKENMTSDPLESNSRIPSTKFEQEFDPQRNNNEEIEVERIGQVRESTPQAVIPKNINAPAMSKDPEKRSYEEYEYSETSLLSQQKIIRKQKRYMYNVEQPPLIEEPSPSIFDSTKPAISNNFPDKKGKQNDDIRSLQLEEFPSEVSDEELVNNNCTALYNQLQDINEKERNLQQSQNDDLVNPEYSSEAREGNLELKSIPHNGDIEKNNAFQNAGEFIDQEYYEQSTNKRRMYKSTKKQFESNQRGYKDLSQYMQPAPSQLMQIQPQEHTALQGASYNRRNAKSDNTLEPTSNQLSYNNQSSNDKNMFQSNSQPAANNQMESEINLSNPFSTLQVLTHAPQARRVSQHDTSQNRNMERDNAYRNTDIYIDQEYYEASTSKNKSYKSSRKFASRARSEVDPDLNRPGPSRPLQSISQNNRNVLVDKDSDSEDEPTRDTAVSGLQSSGTRPGANELPASYHKPQQHQSHESQLRGQSFQGEKSNTVTVKSLGSTVPSKDGDIVILIRQQRAKKEQVVPNITVDVTDKHRVTPSQINQQTVKIKELKPKDTSGEMKIILPRKPKSPKTYRVSSDSSSDGDIESSLRTESNEEQILDTTHYNLTLKSQTTVDISKSEKANLKSKAEVRVTPLSPRLRVHHGESCSDTKMTEERESTSYETSSAETGACDGNQVYQSPIKIDSFAATIREYPRLRLHSHWNATGKALLENNGKTLRASLPDYKQEDLPWLEGGPLNGRYIFYELHFHWGRKDCCGAEHIIDGERHSLEAHFLYIKSEYDSLTTGMQYTDGLATIGVKFDVGGPPHQGLQRLIKDVGLIREPDTGVIVPAETMFAWLQPTIESAQGYYSYKGTLTKNPPCVDCVTWLIFPKPIVFCCQQSSEFRKLKSTTGEELRKNFRTPMPLNNRPVYYVPLDV